MITVKKLKKILEGMEDSRVIILSKDSEGNGFSPLEGVFDDSVYKAECNSGEVGFEKLTPELEEQGYSKEDVIKGKKAVILYPVN